MVGKKVCQLQVRKEEGGDMKLNAYKFQRYNQNMNF